MFVATQVIVTALLEYFVTVLLQLHPLSGPAKCGGNLAPVVSCDNNFKIKLWVTRLRDTNYG